MIETLAPAFAALGITAMLCVTSYRAFRGWLDLKRPRACPRAPAATARRMSACASSSPRSASASRSSKPSPTASSCRAETRPWEDRARAARLRPPSRVEGSIVAAASASGTPTSPLQGGESRTSRAQVVPHFHPAPHPATKPKPSRPIPLPLSPEAHLRVLLLGATGLIGSAIAARLRADGHEVAGVTRTVDAAARRVPVDRWILLDLRAIRAPEDWLPHLDGIDAVVNCAGALQDSVARFHRQRPSRRARRACGGLRAGRSAAGHPFLGDGRGPRRPRPLSRAPSRQGDAALEASGLDWVILRPSVVRRAAGLWRQRPVPRRSPRCRSCRAGRRRRAARRRPARRRRRDGRAPARARTRRRGSRWTSPGRNGWAFGEVVAAYRRWLGWTPGAADRRAGLPDRPRCGGSATCSPGSAGGRRSARTARREIAARRDRRRRRLARSDRHRAAVAGAALAAEPASVQERWFARLYLLKPVAFGTLRPVLDPDRR